MRRMLLVADVLGLSIAYAVSRAALPSPGEPAIEEVWKALVFVATLPVWIVGAKLLSLYDRDEERTDHTTADDFTGVFHLVTAGAWLIVLAQWATLLNGLTLERILVFWAAALVLVMVVETLQFRDHDERRQRQEEQQKLDDWREPVVPAARNHDFREAESG